MQPNENEIISVTAGIVTIRRAPEDHDYNDEGRLAARGRIVDSDPAGRWVLEDLPLDEALDAAEARLQRALIEYDAASSGGGSAWCARALVELQRAKANVAQLAGAMRGAA